MENKSFSKEVGDQKKYSARLLQEMQQFLRVQDQKNKRGINKKN